MQSSCPARPDPKSPFSEIAQRFYGLQLMAALVLPFAAILLLVITLIDLAIKHFRRGAPGAEKGR